VYENGLPILVLGLLLVFLVWAYRYVPRALCIYAGKGLSILAWLFKQARALRSPHHK